MSAPHTVPLRAAAATQSDDEVARIRRAVLVLARRLRQQASGDTLSATEMSVLGRVSRGEADTPGRLAKAEHVQPPSMTKVLERLDQLGFLARRPHPDDGRQQLLSITEQGSEFIEHTREQRTLWLSQHIDQLTSAERTALTRAAGALEKLADLP